ncbi:hypothetical protein ETH_00036590, partial [Eimeria tenella]
MLRKMLRNIPHCLTEADIKEVAENTQAFVAADLALLLRTAATAALRKSLLLQQQQQQQQRALGRGDFAAALRAVRPSGLKALACEVPQVTWEDIGGYCGAKLLLQQCVEWPVSHSSSFQQLRLLPPKGLLLYGPPGCSKTLLAKAVATESKMNFLSVKGPELFSKWVGESEKAIRDLF